MVAFNMSDGRVCTMLHHNLPSHHESVPSRFPVHPHLAPPEVCLGSPSSAISSPLLLRIIELELHLLNMLVDSLHGGLQRINVFRQQLV